MVLPVLVKILMPALCPHLDLIAGERAHIAICQHGYAVYVPSDREREFIALFLAAQVLIGDLQHSFSVVSYTVIPPVVIFSVLIAVEVDDHIAVLTFPGIIAHDLYIRHTVALVMPVGILIVLNIYVIRSPDRAVPSREHPAVPFPFVVFYRLNVSGRLLRCLFKGGFSDDLRLFPRSIGCFLRRIGFFLCRHLRVCRLRILSARCAIGISWFFRRFRIFLLAADARLCTVRRFISRKAVFFIVFRYDRFLFSLPGIRFSGIRAQSAGILPLFFRRLAPFVLRGLFRSEGLLRIGASAPGDIRGEDSSHIGECKHTRQ